MTHFREREDFTAHRRDERMDHPALGHEGYAPTPGIPRPGGEIGREAALTGVRTQIAHQGDAREDQAHLVRMSDSDDTLQELFLKVGTANADKLRAALDPEEVVLREIDEVDEEHRRKRNGHKHAKASLYLTDLSKRWAQYIHYQPDGKKIEYVQIHEDQRHRVDQEGVWREVYYPHGLFRKTYSHQPEERIRVGADSELVTLRGGGGNERRYLAIYSDTYEERRQQRRLEKRQARDKEESTKSVEQRVVEFMTTTLFPKEAKAEGIQRYDLLTENAQETQVLQGLLAKEVAKRLSLPINPNLPEYEKLHADDVLPFAGEFLGRVFMPYGARKFIEDRAFQLGGILGGSAFFFPWPFPGILGDLPKGLGFGVFALAFERGKRFMTLQKKGLLEGLLQAELAHVRQEHPEVTDRNEILKMMVDRMYVERNWKRAQKLEKKDPNLTMEQIVQILKKKDLRNNLIKGGAVLTAILALGVGAPVLSGLLTLIAGHSVVIPALVTWGNAINLWLASWNLSQGVIASTHAVGFAAGLGEFLSIAKIVGGVSLGWSALMGLPKLPAKWREARKVIELKKQQKAFQKQAQQ